ncbi:hypothetical protein GC175_08600 [bacterium]|nr:hypothetical protein [bacterium]
MNKETLERLARFNETVEELGTLLAEIEGEQAADVSLEDVFEEIRERRVEVLRGKYGIDGGDASNLSALGKLKGH